MSGDEEEVTPQRLVGLKECDNGMAASPFFAFFPPPPQHTHTHTYERRDAEIGAPVSSGRVPHPVGAHRARFSEELGARLLPVGSSTCFFRKQPGQRVPAARRRPQQLWFTERFWKAGFSGSILPLEEGRDSTSASLSEDKREEEPRFTSEQLKNDTPQKIIKNNQVLHVHPSKAAPLLLPQRKAPRGRGSGCSEPSAGFILRMPPSQGHFAPVCAGRKETPPPPPKKRGEREHPRPLSGPYRPLRGFASWRRGRFLAPQRDARL